MHQIHGPISAAAPTIFHSSACGSAYLRSYTSGSWTTQVRPRGLHWVATEQTASFADAGRAWQAGTRQSGMQYGPGRYVRACLGASIVHVYTYILISRGHPFIVPSIISPPSLSPRILPVSRALDKNCQRRHHENDDRRHCRHNNLSLFIRSLR